MIKNSKNAIEFSKIILFFYKNLMILLDIRIYVELLFKTPVYK